MSMKQCRRARITSTGSYIPEFRLTNDALARMVETSDDWIRERTGIAERRINTTLSAREMAHIAAKRALDAANLAPESLDLIIATTVTNDNFTPALACFVQADLGAVNAFAFDLNAGCSGFVYALETASAFISSERPGAKRIDRVLIVCAENLSRLIDYTDRASCILFGDGAGAPSSAPTRCTDFLQASSAPTAPVQMRSQQKRSRPSSPGKTAPFETIPTLLCPGLS